MRGKRVAVDQERAARLRRARETAEYDSAAEAWRAFRWEGIALSSYQQMENGTRGCLKHVPRFARSFRVKEEWLRSGRGTPKDGDGLVALVGIIGPFGLISDKKTEQMPDKSLGDVESPPVAGEYLAYTVEGDFNYPSLFNGDTVYTTLPARPDAALGKQCIVKLDDGTRRICILSQGSAAGLYLLTSMNASPVSDARVLEAAPIVWIRRG